MAKIATRKFNKYQQEVRKKQAEIQKQSNALALQQINEGNDANLAALQTRTDLADQGWANAEFAHRSGVSNLRSNTQDRALNMGNARGSWAGDYIAKSPERTALEQNLGYAKQAQDNELKQIDADRTLAAKEYAHQLADYELERKRQAAQEYADTHYNYTAPKAGPPAPGPEPQPPKTEAPIYDPSAYAQYYITLEKNKAAWNQYSADWDKWYNGYKAYYGIAPTSKKATQ
jgi:hypothetical protein